MLIAISGSQGSGKSCLLQSLQHDNLPIVERKTSRSILQDWNVTLSEVNNNPELTIKFQDEILLRKFNDEKKLIESNKIAFTERTFMDLFTYALISIGKDNEYSEWINSYYKKCAELTLQSYKSICFLPGGQFDIQHDNVRGSNKYYGLLVDNTLIHFTRMAVPDNKINIIRSISISDRKNEIWDIIHKIS